MIKKLAISAEKEEIRKLNEQIINLKLEQENTDNRMKKNIRRNRRFKKGISNQNKIIIPSK